MRDIEKREGKETESEPDIQRYIVKPGNDNEIEGAHMRGTRKSE